MKRGQAGNSTALTIRVPVALDRKLAREARRLRLTRSETARVLLATALAGSPSEDPAEARRQSRLASQRASEKDVSEFIASAVDLRG
jgi:hypothetical protein